MKDNNIPNSVSGTSTPNEKIPSSLPWQVDMGLSESELTKPVLILISQPLRYYLENKITPSLQLQNPVTTDELNAIVEKFPVGTFVEICHGGGQNLYRYEAIGGLQLTNAKTKIPFNSWEKAKSDSQKWLNENQPHLEKWLAQGRKIKLCTSSHFMEVSDEKNKQAKACNDLYEKLLSDYKSGHSPKKELNDLFKNFANQAVESLYCDLIQSCATKKKTYYFVNSDSIDPPKALELKDLKSILFEFSLKYLIHETAVLCELSKENEFQYLFYKQKPLRNKNNNDSSSDCLNFKTFSEKLLELLWANGLTHSRMQYREYKSTPASESLKNKNIKNNPTNLEPSHKRSSPPNTSHRRLSPNSSPPFRSSSPAISIPPGCEVVIRPLSNYRLLIPSATRNSSRNSNGSSSPTSDLSNDFDGFILDSSFDNKYHHRDVKLIPSDSPKLVNNRGGLAIFCYKLLCHMINSEKFTQKSTVMRVTRSPFIPDIKNKLLDFAIKKETEEFTVIEINNKTILPEFLSVYRQDIQTYSCDLFKEIYSEQVLEYTLACRYISDSYLDSQYIDDLTEFMEKSDSNTKPTSRSTENLNQIADQEPLTPLPLRHNRSGDSSDTSPSPCLDRSMSSENFFSEPVNTKSSIIPFTATEPVNNQQNSKVVAVTNSHSKKFGARPKLPSAENFNIYASSQKHPRFLVGSFPGASPSPTLRRYPGIVPENFPGIKTPEKLSANISGIFSQDSQNRTRPQPNTNGSTSSPKDHPQTLGVKPKNDF